MKFTVSCHAKIQGNTYNNYKTKRTLSSDKENQEQGRMRVGGQVYDFLIILSPPNYYYVIFMLQTLM